MPENFEDVSRWPISRYFREVVASQPDGRILLFFGKVNITVGVLVALSLIFAPITSHIGLVHVLLLICMPLIGLVWFVRDMPVPTLTAYVDVVRPHWQCKVSALIQLIPALLPWVALVKSHVR